MNAQNTALLNHLLLHCPKMAMRLEPVRGGWMPIRWLTWPNRVATVTWRKDWADTVGAS